MVYVVHNASGRNLLPARSYGKLQELFKPRLQDPDNTEAAISRLRQELSRFSPDDHLLLIGDPVLIGLTIAVAAERTKRLKLLKWDRQCLQYYEVTADLS